MAGNVRERLIDLMGPGCGGAATCAPCREENARKVDALLLELTDHFLGLHGMSTTTEELLRIKRGD